MIMMIMKIMTMMVMMLTMMMMVQVNALHFMVFSFARYGNTLISHSFKQISYKIFMNVLEESH